MTALPRMVYNNKFNLPALPPPGTFNGQTILITGSSGGLGLAAAVHFVSLGASTVIITARSHSRGQTARETIEAQTNTQGKNIVRVMELNMSTFTGCKTFTEKLKADVKSIDYVLLNAGILNIEHKSSIEGWEETLQVNVLSTALVALLLLPWIKEAGKGKAHLGFVTSGTHTSVDIGGDFPKENVLEYFNQKENWPTKGRGMYGLSKLLEMYVVAEISKLALGPDGSPQVIVNPMCPGLCKSDLGREYSNKGFLYSVGVNTFMTAVAKTTEGGARTYVLAALTTTAENGKYVRHYMTEEEYKALAEKNITGPEGQKIQAEVWKEVLAVLEEKVPEVKDIACCTST